MIKRVLSAVMALCLTMGCLASCGNTDSSTQSKASPESSAAEEQESSQAEADSINENDESSEQTTTSADSSEEGAESSTDSTSAGAVTASGGTTGATAKTTSGGAAANGTTTRATSKGQTAGTSAAAGKTTTKAAAKTTTAAGSKGTAKVTAKTTAKATTKATTKAAASTPAAQTVSSMKFAESHDPSIVKGYVKSDVSSISSSTVVKGVKDSTYSKEVYFIFGSHLAFAYSFDLQSWVRFTNNINTNYNTLFKSAFDWAKKGDSVYQSSGNMWAPDVIYNTKMGKWCMYMSINGCSWNSSIVLLTADSLSGSWSYAGTVVYSGFCDDDVRSFTETDYTKATGETALADRYKRSAYTCKDGGTNCTSTTWSNGYGAHAIDPCVVYDESGSLWMSYGSWSGGIWMIKLDASTGLRDYNTKYSYSSGKTDPYMGYLLAGGGGRTGEASYIQKIGSYYYLFVSYGGLVANGGYSMRVFRSAKVNGPYTDASGDLATKLSSNLSNAIKGTVGDLLMFNYKWSYMKQGYVAQGHNSAFVDDDGRAYVVYHTRFSNRGELHQVRVHQLFTTESGLLTAAPFSYAGEKAAAVTAKDIAGSYETIFLETTDYASKTCNVNVTLRFNADGTVSGSKSGTWSFSSKLGSPYVTVTLGGQTYEGLFIKQHKETAASAAANAWTSTAAGSEAMCFTLMGRSTERAVWGYMT